MFKPDCQAALRASSGRWLWQRNKWVPCSQETLDDLAKDNSKSTGAASAVQAHDHFKFVPDIVYAFACNLFSMTGKLESWLT